VAPGARGGLNGIEGGAPGHHGSSEKERAASLRDLFIREFAVPKLPAIPVPAWHKKILDERMKSPSNCRAQPWAQVRREIETALRRRRRHARSN